MPACSTGSPLAPWPSQSGGELGSDPIVHGALRQVDGASTLQAQHRCAQIEIVIAQDAVLNLEAAAGLGEVRPLLLCGTRVEAQRHDLPQHAGNIDAEDGPIPQHELAVAVQAIHELALIVSGRCEPQVEIRLAVDSALAGQPLQHGEETDALGLQLGSVSGRAARSGLQVAGKPTAIGLQSRRW